MKTQGNTLQHNPAKRVRRSAWGGSLGPLARRIRCQRVEAAAPTLTAPPSQQEAAESPRPDKLRKISSLPVVEGLPYFGMLIQTMGPKGFDYDALLEEHDTDAIVLNFGAVLGRRLFISVPQDVYQVLHDQGEALQQKMPDNTRAILMPQDHDLSDKEAKPWRKTMSKVLTPNIVMNIQVPLMIPEFLECISRRARSGEEFLWRKEVRFMVFNVACRAIMGDLLSKKELEYLFPVACTNTDAQFALNFGLKEGIPFTKYWRGLRARREGENFVAQKLYEELQDRERLKAEGGMLHRLIECMESEGLPTEGNNWEVAKMLAVEIRFLLFSGTDTTAYTAARMMQRLARHPEWLDALWEEQQRLIAEFGEELDRRVISRSAVAMSVYQEIMRLEGAAPVLFRDAKQDTVIGDIEVPAGTKVCLSVGSVTKKTGNGSSEFDPDQWLSENRTKVQFNNVRDNLSFGAGTRRCVGQHLATIEIVLLMIVIARYVKRVEMSEEEMLRTFYTISHPTDQPLRLIAR